MGDLIERLRAFANRESEISRSMAEAKSQRQADNPDGECVYAWLKPEQTLSGQAAVEIAALREQVAELEGHLRGVIGHFVDRGEGSQAPGHNHDTPGIWDADNAHGIAGEQCEWCAKWNAARAAINAMLGGRDAE